MFIRCLIGLNLRQKKKKHLHKLLPSKMAVGIYMPKKNTLCHFLCSIYKRMDILLRMDAVNLKDEVGLKAPITRLHIMCLYTCLYITYIVGWGALNQFINYCELLAPLSFILIPQKYEKWNRNYFERILNIALGNLTGR